MATEEKTVVLSGLARTLVRGGHIEKEKAEELFKKSQKKNKYLQKREHLQNKFGMLVKLRILNILKKTTTSRDLL